MSDTEPRCPECIKRVDSEREFIATFVETAAHYVGHGFLATEIRKRKQHDPFRDLTELCEGHLKRSGLLDRKVREAVDAALDACLNIVDAEEELCGPMPFGQRALALADPEKFYRGVVSATKASILTAIRAREETSRRQSVDKSKGT